MFSSIILAERLVLVAIEKLYKITIIDNETGLRFITGDWPVVNLNSLDDKTVRIFWRISPCRAVLVNPTNFDIDEIIMIKRRVLEESGESRILWIAGLRETRKRSAY